MPTPDDTTTAEVETPELETVADIPYSNALDDPMMASLRETFGDLIKDDEEKPEAPATDPDPDPEPEAPEPATTTGKAPAVSVTRAKPVTREDLLEVIREARTAPLPPSPPPAPAAPAPKEEALELTEEETDEVAMAEHAAKLLPDKYAELPTKLRRFYRDQQEYIRQHEHEYGRSFDDEDSEWKRFLEERRPFMPPHDRTKVERDRILAEARAMVDTEKKKLSEEFEARARRLEAQPIHERKLKEFDEKSKEALKPSGEDDIETDIFEQKRRLALGVVDAYWRIKTGIEPWDAEKNPAHRYLDLLVRQEGENFARNGGKARIRDGRQFLPIEVFVRLPPEQKAKAWSFSDDDIVNMVARRAKQEADAEVKATFERNTKAGWAKGNRPAARVNGKPEPKPKGAVTPAPGRAPGVAAPGTTNGEYRPAADIFAIRGLPMPGEAPLQ